MPMHIWRVARVCVTGGRGARETCFDHSCVGCHPKQVQFSLCEHVPRVCVRNVCVCVECGTCGGSGLCALHVEERKSSFSKSLVLQESVDKVLTFDSGSPAFVYPHIYPRGRACASSALGLAHCLLLPGSFTAVLVLVRVRRLGRCPRALPLLLRRAWGATGEQVVPPKAWDALQSWYEGGPFLERRVINYHGSLQLELFPLSLKVRSEDKARVNNARSGFCASRRSTYGEGQCVNNSPPGTD